MQATRTCSLQAGDIRTYLYAMLFVAGNIVLPQLCHLMPQGGLVWLPIYFFTLIGAYAFGWRTGLIVAVASPLVNSALFAMPPAGALPVILMKSVLLALFAAFAARKAGRVRLLAVAAAVIASQAVGSLGEWAITGSAAMALLDVRIGLPGILLQIFGGTALLRALLR